MFKIIKSEKALTLIELIVSIAILSIIVVPTSNMFLTATKINIMSKDKIIAVNLSQDAVEAARENEVYELNSKYDIDTTVSYANKYEIIENQASPDSDYSAVITIDEETDSVKIYSLNNSSRSLEWTTTDNSMELIVTDTQIKINEVIIINSKDPIKIRIETYDQNDNDILTKEFRIKNETSDEIITHVVKMIKDDFTNDNKAYVKIIKGRVKVVDNLYCKISSDNIFDIENDQNRLLDIRANVKKNSDIITELKTIKKVR